MGSADDVVKFWLDEVGPEGWYKQDDALDATIRGQFEGLWHDALAGRCARWLTEARGTLGYIILLDQFSRNMFRGEDRAFETDRLARAASKKAIQHGWDLRVAEPERQFVYMPLVHSENLYDQDRAVRLMKERMPQTGAGQLLHARVHRDVIRRFGRFPFRNTALGRKTTAAEAQFMDEGGYGAAVLAYEAEVAG